MSDEVPENLIKKVASKVGIRDRQEAEGFVTGEYPEEKDIDTEKLLEGYNINLELDLKSLADKERVAS